MGGTTLVTSRVHIRPPAGQCQAVGLLLKAKNSTKKDNFMKSAGQLEWTDYLNAQLLHLRPNKFLKIIWGVSFSIMALTIIYVLYKMYRYFIGGFYTGVISMLPALAFPIIFPIILLLYRYVLLPYQIKKIFNQQKELHAPFEMEITEVHLVASNEFGNSIRPWKNFIKWKENEELITLYHSDVMFTIIPKRLLTDPQQLEMLKSYITKNGIKAA